MVSEHEVLELQVQEIESELVLFHFFERPIRRPTVCRHPVSRCHDSRTVLTLHAVNEDGLARGIVHDAQELRELRPGRRHVTSHGNLHVSHAGLLGQRLLVRFGVVAGQIDDRLDPEGREIGVVAPFRLRAAVQTLVDTSEVVDVNARGGDGGVRGWTSRTDDGGNGQRERSKQRSGTDVSGLHAHV